jgi:hypothetical protein
MVTRPAKPGWSRAILQIAAAGPATMAHDRLDDDVLPLTQEFLSLMVGVRRIGVTEAIQALERQGLIRHARGQIVMQNRKGMER